MADKANPPCSTPNMVQTNAQLVTMPVSVAAQVQPITVSTVGAAIATPHTTSTVTVTATSANSYPPTPHIHQTIAHPSVPPSPIPQHFHCPQVQVIQQPIHSPTYLPQMYSPQQQLLMPGNITMSPGIQVIAAGKTCVPNQLASHLLSGKQVLQGQSNYIPSTTNQTLVIGQLGMLPSQSPMLNQHAKQMAESQKVRPYVMSQAGTLQSKSPILPHPQSHAAVTMAGTQVLNSSQFKQLTSQATLASTPQLITTQAPPGAMIASQSQIINSLQAISTSLPPGLTWATHGGLQSHAVITAQNPIFIRSNQQQEMFIQSSPQAPTAIQPQPGLHGQILQQQHHPNAKAKQGVEIAPNIHPKTQVATMGIKTLSSILPSTAAPIRPASSVATQTNTMVHASLHPRPQLKQRAKSNVNRVVPGPGGIQVQQKADAANQTRSHLSMPQIQPKPPMEAKAIAARNPVLRTDSPGVNILLASTIAATQPKPMVVSYPPNKALNKKLSEAMDTVGGLVSGGGPAIMLNGKDETTNKCSATFEGTSMEVDCSALASLASPKSASAAIGKGKATHDTNKGTSSSSISTSASMLGMHMLPVSNVCGADGIKDKHPQKAIIKPHVLTHVIEGYVIQEAPDPFPVNRSSLLTDFVPPKPVTTADKGAKVTESESIANNQEMTQTNNISEQMQSQDVLDDCWAGRDKREELDVGLSKCEFCGKPDAKSRFKRSKRFCSTSCAKRYNVGCTKRLGLFTSPGTDSPGKYVKKKKHGMKMRKGLRKIPSGGRLTYNTDEWVRSQNTSESTAKEEETNSSNSGGDGSLSPVTLSSQKDIMEVDVVESEPNKNPLKWTVQDVFEFIKGLPGCADYADEFRMQEIDGQALLLLKEDHLMTAMSMKLGPALKICARINTLKEEVQRQ